VEHKHHHIIEMGLSLLVATSMPLKYWDEVFIDVVYFINRTLTKLVNMILQFIGFLVHNLIISIFDL
jgi:hypothetical protein